MYWCALILLFFFTKKSLKIVPLAHGLVIDLKQEYTCIQIANKFLFHYFFYTKIKLI